MADSHIPASSDKAGATSPAPAVTRAAAVLDALAASATGRLTLIDLSREVGIPKSSTSNLLLALEEARLISRQGSEFTLGRKLVAGAWVAKESPGYLKGLYDTSKSAMTFARASKIKVPGNADAMLDGLN